MTPRLGAAALLCACGLRCQAPPSIQDLIDSGHYKRARVLVEARYKENPNNAETLCLMSRTRQLWERLDEAEKFAEKAVALNPKEACYHFQLAEVSGQKAQKVSVFHQIGLGRQFKKEADLTLQLDPKHVGALKDMMMFYLEAPGIIGGDKNKARGIADQLMKIDPVEGYFAQITLARKEKQEGGSEEYLRKAVEARPDSYAARIALGSHLLNQKKFEEADRHSKEALKLHPDRTGSYVVLALSAALQDRWADVDAILAQAEKAVPDNFIAFFRVANNCLGRKTELARAERYFRKYLTMEQEPGTPSHATAHWRLGLVLEQLGRKSEALAELDTAVKADSANAQAKADWKRLKG
jgi:tetratricopeptide (TPR) repeat protein